MATNPFSTMLKHNRKNMSLMFKGYAPRERLNAKVKNKVNARVKKKYRRLVCEICKSKPRGIPLQYHHKNMKNTDDSLNNIQLLCPNHHMLKHKKVYRKKYKDIFGRVTGTRLVKKTTKRAKPKKKTSLLSFYS